MAFSLNQILLRGKLGRDGETKFSKGGTPFTKFSVATDHGKDEKKETTWHNVTMFGNEATAAQLVKGATVFVMGRQTHTKREDKYYSDVIAEVVTVEERRGAGASYTPPASQPLDGKWEGGTDEDVPF